MERQELENQIWKVIDDGIFRIMHYSSIQDPEDRKDQLDNIKHDMINQILDICNK